MNPTVILRRLSISLICISLWLFAGCATFRGGAPKQSFDVNKDIEALAKHFEQATSISNYYDLETKDAADKEKAARERNKFITGRLVLTDLRYVQFVRGLTKERQLLDSATDIAIMSLNLVGAGVSGETAKTVLHSISAGLGGAKVTIDRDFYFDKTVPALVAAMNAERAKSRVPVMKGLQQDIDTYPFHMAVTDVHLYYEAGTFLGAIQAIQADAAVKESAKKQEIEEIVDRGPKYYDELKALLQAVRKLDEADLEKAWTAFEPDVKVWASQQGGNLTYTKPADVKAFQALYTKVTRTMKPEQRTALHDRFVEQGLIKL